MNKQTIDALKSAGYVALWTFLGLFAAALTGWLADVVDWATSEDAAVVFPDPTVLVKAIVAAVAAAFSGITAAIFRLAQAAGFLPGTPPAYLSKPHDDRGESQPFLVLTIGLLVFAGAVMLTTSTSGG